MDTRTVETPDGSTVTMYPCEAQGAWFEQGSHGRIGSLYAPMHTDGSFDPDEVGEIEVSYEDATGEPEPTWTCNHNGLDA